VAKRAQLFVVVELSTADARNVRLALDGARPVEFFEPHGGNVPSHDEVLALWREQARRSCRHAAEEERWQMSNDTVTSTR